MVGVKITTCGELAVELGQSGLDELSLTQRGQQPLLHRLAAPDETLDALTPAQVHASAHPRPVGFLRWSHLRRVRTETHARGQDPAMARGLSTLGRHETSRG